MDWHFFTTLNDLVVAPILAQMQSMLGGVCSEMQPIVLALLAVWLCVVGFDIANHTKTMEAAARDFFIAAMVVITLQVANYTQYISDLFLTAIPNSVSAALGGSGSPINALDTLLGQAMSVADQTYNALPDSWKGYALAIAVVFFMGFAVVSVGYVFLILISATLTSMLAVVVGPVFLALAAIPPTRRFAAGWLDILVSGCVTQLLAIAVIRLMTGAQGVVMLKVGHSIATSDDTPTMIWGLCQIGLLLMFSVVITKKIPMLAERIAGGVSHGFQGAHSATFGAAAVAAGAAYAGAKGGVKAAAGALSGAASGIGSSTSSVQRGPAGPSMSQRNLANVMQHQLQQPPRPIRRP